MLTKVTYFILLFNYITILYLFDILFRRLSLAVNYRF